MTPREIDALVAKHVFGIRVMSYLSRVAVEKCGGQVREVVARAAFEQADAMLAEREKAR